MTNKKLTALARVPGEDAVSCVESLRPLAELCFKTKILKLSFFTDNIHIYNEQLVR